MPLSLGACMEATRWCNVDVALSLVLQLRVAVSPGILACLKIHFTVICHISLSFHVVATQHCLHSMVLH